MSGNALGRWLFASAIVAFGLLHLFYGDFVTRVVPWWPDWIPGRTACAALTGVALVAAGAALAADWRTRQVGVWLGVLLVVSFLLLGVPAAAADSALGRMWTRAGKALALGGGAFLVARASAGVIPDGRLAALGSLGSGFFGAFLMQSGVQHFVHLPFVATLVPSWVGVPYLWAQAAGIALLAGGAGVILPKTARLAGTMTGLMIFSWVLMVHVPRALAPETRSANETTAVFEALAMSGIALLVASTSVQRVAGRARRDQPA